MITSRLTSKYKTTIPKPVRRALDLEAGDRVIYHIQNDNVVIISNARSLDLDYLNPLSKTLNEWMSDEDERAFKNL